MQLHQYLIKSQRPLILPWGDTIGARVQINEYAIRVEFGGKDGLYSEAIEYYVEAAEQNVLAPIRQGTAQEVDYFFQEFTKDSSNVASPWGCLVVNAGLENVTDKNPRVAELTSQYWARLETAMKMALERSQNASLNGFDCGECARVFVTAVMGMHVANRSAGSVRAAAQMAKVVVGGWKSGCERRSRDV